LLKIRKEVDIMAKLTGKGLVDFATSKLGVPYVYGAKGADGKFTQEKFDFLSRNYKSMFTLLYKAKAKKFIGKVCCDCSGLISWYTGKVLGSAQLYSTASKRGLIKDVNKAPIGAVLWKEGHVGIFVGNGYCIEEKGIDYGCVKSKISNTHFTHWLTFDYMDYEDIKEPVITHSKKSNPYKKPTSTLNKGDKGEEVEWVQFELREAGYNVAIDGDFGKKTLEYVVKFQESCKIDNDGVVGNVTISKLVNDK
jgi:cell wall-associated NlpC family hydrolase